MTNFQDKLLTRTDCDEAGVYAVPNVVSPRDLVFRPDLLDINCTIIIMNLSLRLFFLDIMIKPQPPTCHKDMIMTKLMCLAPNT